MGECLARIEKIAILVKRIGKVFMMPADPGGCGNEKGHVRTWPFVFWLPDLDSNQGPAD